MFGLCDPGLPELGYVGLNELQAVRGPWGLGIERDLYWTPKTRGMYEPIDENSAMLLAARQR